MRLTLRTLLAYLDDILEPADAQELGQKIEESEFASGLVHRIRSVTRKLRLGAPKLTGKGMGLDANTVAEYLDNTLPQDRVPDFEKLCLESDVQLAEVASCHQILTLVLGEPADVDPALQDQMRSLSLSGAVASSYNQTAEDQRGEVVAPPVSVTRPATKPAPADISLGSTKARAPESGFRLLPIAATLAVAFLLALVALVAMGPLDENHPVVGGLFGDTSVASRDKTPDVAAPQDALRSAQPQVDPLPKVDAGPPQPQQQTDTGTATDSTGGTPADATDPGVDSPALPKEMDAAVPNRSAEDPVAPVDDRAEPPGDAVPEPAVGIDPGQPAVMPDQDPALPADDVADRAEETGGESTGTKDAAKGDLGRYTSDQQVAARRDPETGSWFRLPGLSSLAAGDRVLALPTYRPQFLLAPGLQVVLVGPAEITLQAPDAAGVPALEVQYGRVIVVTDGKSGSHLRFQIGERTSQVTFVDTDSMLALEVQRYLPPGVDPEATAPYFLSQALAVNGQLQWLDGEATEPLLIDAGQLAAMVDTERAVLQATASRPDWLDSRGMSLIDRDASKQLEPKLSLDRPLTVSLQEQVTNRLVEVKTLAVRSLGQLNDFDSFVDALNDADLRSYWNVLFDGLRAGMARSPASATDVRVAFERLRGDDGRQLYRLLRGYSPAQLGEGGATELVDSLENSSMDIRVLAYENLRRITQKTHLFRPDREPRQQKPAILNWRKSLQNGTIVYQDPPPSLPDRSGDGEP